MYILCILKTAKPVLWETVKIQMKCSLMLHFISVCTVCYNKNTWGRSGSVVEYLTRDRRAAGSSLTGIVVSLSKNINPSLVLVQPRKTRPFIAERLLMGRKEVNQTNNKNNHRDRNTSRFRNLNT